MNSSSLRAIPVLLFAAMISHVSTEFTDEADVEKQLAAFGDRLADPKFRHQPKAMQDVMDAVATFLHKAPSHIGILSLGCSVAALQNDHATVKSYAEAALLVAPGNPILSLHLAGSLLELKEFSTARVVLGLAVDDPSVPAEWGQRLHHMLHQSMPTLMIKEGMALLRAAGIEAKNPSSGGGFNASRLPNPAAAVSLFVAASRSPLIYQPLATAVLSLVGEVAQEMIQGCHIPRVTSLLEGWFRASKSHGIGLSKHLLSVLGQAYQIHGKYKESRAAARQCITLCEGYAPGEGRVSPATRGSDPEWGVCSNCYILSGDYDYGFDLIRQSHVSKREGREGVPVQMVGNGGYEVMGSIVSVMKLEHDMEQIIHLRDTGRVSEHGSLPGGHGSVPVGAIISTYTEAIAYLQGLPLPAGDVLGGLLVNTSDFPPGSLRDRLNLYHNKACQQPTLAPLTLSQYPNLESVPYPESVP